MPPVSQWPQWIGAFIIGLVRAAWDAFAGNFKRQIHDED